MADASWIELDGTVNTRDLGGLRAAGGRSVRHGRLVRSDNLQDLTPADVERLVDEVGVRAVADLRTEVEVTLEGPAPLDSRVEVHRLSLFPTPGHNTDVVVTESVADTTGPPVLPWHGRSKDAGDRRNAPQVYLGYLADRPDSILSALRLIAGTDGATIVHCAAGKDRTGVVVALALAEVGVDRESIVTDFALTGERAALILARLAASPTYTHDVADRPVAHHTPQAETMAVFLDTLDDRYGGAGAWLRSQGWSEQDAQALRAALLTD